MDDEIIIQAGQYWKARVAIEDKDIREGDVLLIKSVRDVDNQAHTIILRPHPRWYAANSRCDGEDRFLVAEFFEKFDPCPDYKRIRQAELEEVQGKVTKLQRELAEASTDPTVMKSFVDAGLKKWGKEQKLLPAVVDKLPTPGTLAVDPTTTPEKVEEMKLGMAKAQQIATLQADYIKERVEQISETVKAMTPFYQEQAAAALATTEDVMTHVAKLMKGVKSLDLYVGTDVHIKTIQKGKDAPEEIPLSIMQRKLYMDEELSAWQDVDDKFDYNSDNKFFKALTEHLSLVKQIFATERCIVCMATTRRELEYGNAWETAEKNELNKQVFLLIRNGENLHVVYSPVESHMRSHRLFPTNKEIENIFHDEAWFGEEGRRITFNDVKYTDKLNEHEAIAVHYKRFLILLAGLDHRENLFGTFYEGGKSMKFITPEFQSFHMNFIHDDDVEHLLPEGNRPEFHQWAERKNAYLQSGSRVICLWNDIMNSSTAPAVFKDNWRAKNPYQVAHQVNRHDIVIAYRTGKEIFVKCPVTQGVYGRHENGVWMDSHDRKFEAAVNLSKYKERWQIGFIVLDAVRADELEWYVYDRTNRKDFLRYIRIFKEAIKFLQNEEKKEAPMRAKLAKALADGGVKDTNDAIDKAVIAWRAAHRGKPLAAASNAEEYGKLLNQIWSITRADEDHKVAEAWAKSHELKPLRLVQGGKAQSVVLYCAPTSAEEDNRLWPHAWVHRITLIRQGGKLSEQFRSWKVMRKFDASETTLYEWDDIEEWADRFTPVDRFENKQEYFENASHFSKRDALFKPMEAAVWDKAYALWSTCRLFLLEKSKGTVENPQCMVPFALALREKKLCYLAVGVYDAAYLLYENAPDKERKERLAKEYARQYRMEQKAHNRITGKDDGDGFIQRSSISIYGLDPETKWRPFGLYEKTKHQRLAEVKLDKIDAAVKAWVKEQEQYHKKVQVWRPKIAN